MADMYSDPSSAANNPYLQKSNPYLQANIDNAQGDIVRNWNTTVQPGYNSAMVRSGSFGNEGVNQMNQNAALTTQKALGQVSDSMRMQDYNQRANMYMQQQGIDNSNYWNNNQFNRSLYNDAYSQNMNNLTTGVGLLGTLNGYNSNDLTNANTIQNTPLNYWSNFSNAANGIGQGYGTSQQLTGSTSNPIASALGGAQLGQAAMGWWNRNNAGNTGSSGAPTDASGYALSNYGSGGSAAGVTPYL